MIVLTNGNNTLTALIVNFLLKRVSAADILVTAQHPQQLSGLDNLGVMIRREDFSDPNTGPATFEGADRVLSNPFPGWSRREATGENIARAENCLQAAIVAKVPHIVHIGIINNDMTDLLWHNALDAAVQSSGLPFTILRNNLHTEALLPALRLAQKSGEFVCAFGGRNIAPASRLDYAEAAAIALTDDIGPNRIHELSGLGLTSLGISSVFSRVTGRSIKLREVAAHEVSAILKRQGAPHEVAEELEDLYTTASRGEFSPSTDTLDEVLRHPHTLNEEALRKAVNADEAGAIDERKDGTVIGPEITLRLQHVWPKGEQDLTEVNLSTLSDAEVQRITQQVEDIKRAFERFVVADVVPRIPRTPTAMGRVETLRLFTSDHSMVTDYLLLLSGILGGNGGVLDLISERYTVADINELGLFAEMEFLKLSDTEQ